jgi:CRISPR-associated endonuclease/helicase Cas3
LWQLRQNGAFKKLTDTATTPAPLRPALTRTHLDAWSMTSLDVHPGRAEVGPWIRGWTTDEPQTQVLWRRILPIRDDDTTDMVIRTLTTFFAAARPHVSEQLETETWRVVDLLRSRAKAVLKRLVSELDAEPHDLESEAVNTPTLTRNAIVAVVLGSDRSVERVWRLQQIDDADPKRLHAMIASRMVVLYAGLGGLDKAGLSDAKAGAAPSTLDDERPPPTIEDEAQDASLWSEERLGKIGFRVRRQRHSEDEGGGNWRVLYQRIITRSDEETGNPEAWEWRVEQWVGEGAAGEYRALARRDQFLEVHHREAKVQARRIGQRLGLPDDLVELLAEAAGAHDLGKMRVNWQTFAGNFGYPRRPRYAEPLAKFVKGGHPNLLKIGDDTYRHEFGSVHDLIKQKAFDGRGADQRDLALHVIAAHHGNARPVIAPADELHLKDVSAKLAGEIALRFTRLHKKWGAWGLVWLEALLRAADAAASRKLDEGASEAPDRSSAALSPEGRAVRKDAA